MSDGAVATRMTHKVKYTLAELVEGLDVEIQGDANCVISGVSPIQHATSDSVTFLNTFLTKKYRQFLSLTKAGAVILSAEDAAECPVNAIISRNPYLTYAKVAERFLPTKDTSTGVHPTVVIAKDAQIDPTASIGPYCTIGRRVIIGPDVVIGSGCVIGDDVTIAAGTRLDNHVVIYFKASIGKRTYIASGVVIGSDGFGFANAQGVWHKVPQLGSVIIGDDVEIGANTTVDRGALDDTIISNGVKLDNQIQVGHNVKIGEHTIIAGCVAIAGSAEIGKYCMVGGGSLINGHISICDKVVILGNSGVEKSITEPGMYSSGVVGIVPAQTFRRNNARFHRLDALSERIKTLEAELKALTERLQNENGN